MNKSGIDKKENNKINNPTSDQEEEIDVVDEASMESFPASDPPNYTQRKPASIDKKNK